MDCELTLSANRFSLRDMTQRFLIALFLLLLPLPALGQIPEISTAAKQAVMVDDRTGQVLFARDADARMPTSSMSKVMTMIVVFDALKAGEIKLDDRFLVSEKAWRKGGSKMFVGLDTKVSIEDLIRGVIVQSGNDATIVLAEGLSGSEEAFADRINEKAKEIGMTSSHFVNASGWPDENHYSTAADLALMARYLVRTYPEYYKYYGEESFAYNSIEQQNRNPLLYRDIGADGIKTGHTEAGGYGLIGSGVRGGRRVILVVNGLDSETARAQESAKLLEWGLGRFEALALFEKPSVLAQIPVVDGKVSEVAARPAQALTLTVPKGSRSKLTFKADYKTPLIAPVAAESKIGVLNIMLGDEVLRQVPLVTADHVEQAGFFARTMGKAKRFIGARGL